MARLKGGDVWAWCVVTVTVTAPSGAQVTDVLVGSHANEADFRNGYYEDMVSGCLDRLNNPNRP